MKASFHVTNTQSPKSSSRQHAAHRSANKDEARPRNPSQTTTNIPRPWQSPKAALPPFHPRHPLEARSRRQRPGHRIPTISKYVDATPAIEKPRLQGSTVKRPCPSLPYLSLCHEVETNDRTVLHANACHAGRGPRAYLSYSHTQPLRLLLSNKEARRNGKNFALSIRTNLISQALPCPCCDPNVSGCMKLSATCTCTLDVRSHSLICAARRWVTDRLIGRLLTRGWGSSRAGFFLDAATHVHTSCT